MGLGAGESEVLGVSGAAGTHRGLYPVGSHSSGPGGGRAGWSRCREETRTGGAGVR